MTAAIRCDRPGCDSTRRPDRTGWLHLELPVPVVVNGENVVIRDACSAECAHWIVDELTELITT